MHASASNGARLEVPASVPSSSRVSLQLGMSMLSSPLVDAPLLTPGGSGLLAASPIPASSGGFMLVPGSGSGSSATQRMSNIDTGLTPPAAMTLRAFGGSENLTPYSPAAADLGASPPPMSWAYPGTGWAAPWVEAAPVSFAPTANGEKLPAWIAANAARVPLTPEESTPANNAPASGCASHGSMSHVSVVSTSIPRFFSVVDAVAMPIDSPNPALDTRTPAGLDDQAGLSSARGVKREREQPMQSIPGPPVPLTCATPPVPNAPRSPTSSYGTRLSRKKARHGEAGSDGGAIPLVFSAPLASRSLRAPALMRLESEPLASSSSHGSSNGWRTSSGHHARISSGSVVSPLLSPFARMGHMDSPRNGEIGGLLPASAASTAEASPTGSVMLPAASPKSGAAQSNGARKTTTNNGAASSRTLKPRSMSATELPHSSAAATAAAAVSLPIDSSQSKSHSPTLPAIPAELLAGTISEVGNGAAAGVTIPKPVPGKRGGGFSCHCCKTSKTNIDDLFLCTNVLPKSDGCMLSAAAARDATIALLCGQPIPELPPGAATKRCKKKYCIACMKRLFGSDLMILCGPNLDQWQCPSCLNKCSCAGCERRISGQSETPWRSSKKSADRSASGGGAKAAGRSTSGTHGSRARSRSTMGRSTAQARRSRAYSDASRKSRGSETEADEEEVEAEDQANEQPDKQEAAGELIDARSSPHSSRTSTHASQMHAVTASGRSLLHRATPPVPPVSLSSLPLAAPPSHAALSSPPVYGVPETEYFSEHGSMLLASPASSGAATFRLPTTPPTLLDATQLQQQSSAYTLSGMQVPSSRRNSVSLASMPSQAHAKTPTSDSFSSPGVAYQLEKREQSDNATPSTLNAEYEALLLEKHRHILEQQRITNLLLAQVQTQKQQQQQQRVTSPLSNGSWAREAPSPSSTAMRPIHFQQQTQPTQQQHPFQHSWLPRSHAPPVPSHDAIHSSYPSSIPAPRSFSFPTPLPVMPLAPHGHGHSHSPDDFNHVSHPPARAVNVRAMGQGQAVTPFA